MRKSSVPLFSPESRPSSNFPYHEKKTLNILTADRGFKSKRPKFNSKKLKELQTANKIVAQFRREQINIPSAFTSRRQSKDSSPSSPSKSSEFI